jgi:hypothetical protein
VIYNLGRLPKNLPDLSVINYILMPTKTRIYKLTPSFKIDEQSLD